MIRSLKDPNNNFTVQNYRSSTNSALGARRTEHSDLI